MRLLFARLGLGVCFIMHGFDKIFHGIEGVKATFAGNGIPEFMAYVGEFAAPLMIIIGIFSRIAAIVVLGTVAFILIQKLHNRTLWRFSCKPKELESVAKILQNKTAKSLKVLIQSFILSMLLNPKNLWVSELQLNLED